MFRSQIMSRVELIVPEHDIVAVTEALAASGVFQLTQTGHTGGERAPRYAGDWQDRVPVFAELEQRIQAVMADLGVDEGPPPAETPHLIEPDVVRIDVDRLEHETQMPLRDLKEEQGRLDQLQRQVKQLRTIIDLEVDLESVRDMRYTFALMGTMPVTNLERLRTSLEIVPSALVTLRREEHLATVVLFGTRRDAEILTRAARSAYLNPLQLSESFRGTPAEAIEALEAGVERARQRIEEAQAAIDRLSDLRREHLRHLLWRVRASRTLAETIARYGRLRYTYLVAGWVPTAKLSPLEQEVRQASDKVLIEVETPHRRGDESIPVALKNPPIIRAFQGLVTTYGRPQYGEIDPTPMIALTFPLIFGIMFGDVGHGLVLLLAGLLLASRRVRSLRGLAGIGAVLAVCGAASMIFGVLFGSVFGYEELIDPLWLRPLAKIMDVLLVTVGMGAVLLSAGMILNMINAALARRWGQLIFGHNGLAGLLLYWSLLGLVAGGFVDQFPIGASTLTALALVSGTAVIFSEVLENLVEGHRPLVHGGLGSYLVQLPIELFEMLIGFLSNTLSYVRIGAFAVAHGTLGVVIFIIAGIIGTEGSIGYWIVVLLGNLFIIGFEGMIVGIQTLRLEYYEFFSKFFSGGGARYRPLTLISREEE